MKKLAPELRQQQLQERSATLRGSVAAEAQSLKKPLALADKARAGLQWASRNPVLPLGVSLVLAVVLPKRTLLIWGGRLWGAWTAYNRVRSVVAPKSRRSRTSRK
ncbi:MAG: YqjK-like family protein [Burkholderiaceae bacterium]